MDEDDIGIEHYWARMGIAYRIAQYVLGDLAFNFGFNQGSVMRNGDSITLASAKDAPPGFFEFIFVQALLIARDTQDSDDVKQKADELTETYAMTSEWHRTNAQEQLAGQMMVALAAEIPGNLTVGQFAIGFASALVHISFIGVEIGRRSAQLGLTAKPDATGWISAFQASLLDQGTGSTNSGEGWQGYHVSRTVHVGAFNNAVQALEPYVSENVLEAVREGSFSDSAIESAAQDTWQALVPHVEKSARALFSVANMARTDSNDRTRDAGCGANLIAILVVGLIISGIVALAGVVYG